jgi:hypothetical protein
LFFFNFGAELYAKSLYVKHGAGKLFLDGNYTGEYYKNWKVTGRSRSYYIIPSAFTIDAGVQYSLLDGRVSLSAEMMNIADAQTCDQFGIPLAGRSVAAKARLSFYN